MKRNQEILIIAFAAMGDGISGGDRIFIEFARRWARKIRTEVVVWEQGKSMLERQKLKSHKNLAISVVCMNQWNKFGSVFSYVLRVLNAVFWAFSVNLKNISFVYSASEFWMDLFPVVILKLRQKQLRWVACWFQTAPKPWNGFSSERAVKRYRFKALVYYLVQLPSKWFIKKLADFVLVNNDQEKKVFPELNKQNRALVVWGAVDIEKIDSYQLKNTNKKYDAVFQGRFHPQKGIEEMIDIWNLVVKKIPKAKLVIIGDGPLRKNVELRIKNNGLEKNILLKGYLFDGKEKFTIFSVSKIVVHPSLYDSGGMASSEAMVFGLPVVGFNLDSYKSYYPEGMLKAAIGDKKKFANLCLKLLKNSSLRYQLGQAGRKYILQHRSWDMIAQETLKGLIKI